MILIFIDIIFKIIEYDLVHTHTLFHKHRHSPKDTHPVLQTHIPFYSHKYRSTATHTVLQKHTPFYIRKHRSTEHTPFSFSVVHIYIIIVLSSVFHFNSLVLFALSAFINIIIHVKFFFIDIIMISTICFKIFTIIIINIFIG